MAETTAVPDASAPHAEGGAVHWLMHVPIPLFAMVMGITGLGLAWRKAHVVLHAPQMVGEGVLGLGAVLFVSVALLYLAKALRHPDEVKAEFANPIRVNFFPTVSICLLLLSIAAFDYSRNLSLGLWVVGASLHLLATTYLIGRWFSKAHEINMINPAWFIPVVGNLLVPVAGTRLGFHEISWFFFSIGILYWVILFTIVFYRVVFHNPLPGKFMPTLFILIAPPSIGMIAYMGLNGHQVDTLVRVLFYSGVFITLLNISLIGQFLKVPFFVSWWAYTFPMAAITIASLDYLHAVHTGGLSVLAWGLLGVTSAVILTVLLRTTQALLTGKLFVPD